MSSSKLQDQYLASVHSDLGIVQKLDLTCQGIRGQKKAAMWILGSSSKEVEKVGSKPLGKIRSDCDYDLVGFQRINTVCGFQSLTGSLALSRYY